MDAEPVLLVDNCEFQIAEIDAFLKQGMGADCDLDCPFRQAHQRCLARSTFVSSGQDDRPDTCRSGQRFNCFEMLAGEYLRWRHKGRLSAAFNSVQHGNQRDDRLTAADIAL